MKKLLALYALSLIVSVWAHADSNIVTNSNIGINITPPPAIFLEVTNLLNEGLSTADNSKKIEVINAMSVGLDSFPPCKIHTTNAIYTVAMSGDNDVKITAINEIEAALKTMASNLPIPSFVMAKILMNNYVVALKKEIK